MAYNAVEEASATVGQKFELYPNPAISQITMDVAATLVGSTLQIFGYNGELAREVVITSTKQVIDISDLAKGNYWTMATSSMGTVTSNFIVQ